MRPVVIHVREATGDDDEVFIGRPSKWGNPFAIGRDGSRAEVIDRYDAWLDSQPELLAALPELDGKVLVCFCKPARCHGDVLARRSGAHPPASVGSAPMATTPSPDPGNDEYDDIALPVLALLAKLIPAEDTNPNDLTPLDAALGAEAQAAHTAVSALVARARDAEGIVRLALPQLSKLGRIERVVEGASASPALVAVGSQAKAIVKVMDEYGEAKRAAIARPTPEG